MPTSMHVEVTTACLEAGLHVLVEKPIADDLAGARALRDAARQRHLEQQVGHVERFPMPEPQRMPEPAPEPAPEAPAAAAGADAGV